MELIGNLKTFSWGKLGPSSKVAQLARSNDEHFQIEYQKPYAELWMGDHINGPATIKKTGESLATAIQNDPSLIGGLESLPFLIKILSVNKALSIQVHPNKEESQELHKKFPELYKDGNHKPEIMVALTRFIALCGFRPNEEIYTNLMQSPELIDLLGKNMIDAVKNEGPDGIKKCFSKLLNSHQVRISMCVKKISERFELEQRNDDIGTVFHQLQHDFPNDVGTLCLFFVNILRLDPGQAVYIAANVIHAYLDGDCVECMGWSDNVIRAGLTPKFKDVATTLKTLSYNGAPNKYFVPTPHPDPTFKFTNLYIPPITDYFVAEIIVPPLCESYKIENRTCGSIFIVLSGNAIIDVKGNEIELMPGSIIFLPAVSDGGQVEAFNLQIKSKDNFVAYQALHDENIVLQH